VLEAAARAHEQSGTSLSWTASTALVTAITAVLRRPGWSCHALGDARQVADALRKDAPDVLVVDLGVAAYRKLLARRPKLPPSPPVPVATGGPSLSLAVEVLNLATVAAFLRGSQLAIDAEQRDARADLDMAYRSGYGGTRASRGRQPPAGGCAAGPGSFGLPAGPSCGRPTHLGADGSVDDA